MVNKKKKAMSGCKEVTTKDNLKKIKEEITHEFHVFYDRFTDQIKLLAAGQLQIIQCLDQMQKKFDHMRPENKQKH